MCSCARAQSANSWSVASKASSRPRRARTTANSVARVNSRSQIRFHTDLQTSRRSSAFASRASTGVSPVRSEGHGGKSLLHLRQASALTFVSSRDATERRSGATLRSQSLSSTESQQQKTTKANKSHTKKTPKRCPSLVERFSLSLSLTKSLEKKRLCKSDNRRDIRYSFELHCTPLLSAAIGLPIGHWS